MASETKSLYTIGEVAKIVGVHRTTVSGWIKEGRLEAIRFGHRTVRIKYDDLTKFLAARE